MTDTDDDLRSLRILATLGQLRSMDALEWDALGEHLLAQFQAGPDGGPLVPVSWAIPRLLGKELHRVLGQALADRDSEELPRQ